MLQFDTYETTQIKPKSNTPKIVDNSASSRYIRMENNLVKLAFVATTPEKKVFYKQFISDYKAHSELNSSIINAIDKNLCEINNISELAKKIISEFCNNQEEQKQVVDLIYSSNEYEKLSYEEYTEALCETLSRLNNIKSEIEKEKILNEFMSKDISENDKIEISKKIYEKYTLQN